MLALSQMSQGFQALFFVLSVLCFVIGAFASERVKQVNMVALGLAFFVVVFAYNAVAAA